MKKVIFLVVLCLALVATVGAGTYQALVTMKTNSHVGSTTVAELAFAAGGGSVSPDFVITDPGQANQVLMNFDKVQPNSEYTYYNTLKVTNNKTYDVALSVASASWPMSAAQGDLEIWCNAPYTNMYMSAYGGATGNTLNLAAGASVYITFYLKTNYACPANDYNGTVTFKAYRYEAP